MLRDIILVDDNDQEIGTGEKMAVHIQGLRHRAFSVFVFNSQGELLLQKRAAAKYHGGGLWTNTCCSHPRPGEDTLSAAARRLFEEMGFSCSLREVMELSYSFTMPNGLIENEYDHVFFGEFSGEPTLNPTEAEDWAWVKIDKILVDIKKNPEKYTPWFCLIVEEIYSKKLI